MKNTSPAVGDRVFAPTLNVPSPAPEHDMTVVAIRHGGRIVETEKGDFLAREVKVRR